MLALKKLSFLGAGAPRLFFLSCLALPGCGAAGGDPGSAADLAVAPDGEVADLAAAHDLSARDGGAPCSATCPMCAAGETCFLVEDRRAKPAVVHVAARCLRRCRTGADCPKGMACEELLRDAASPRAHDALWNARACVSDQVVALCPGVAPAGTSCAPGEPRCDDPTTLVEDAWRGNACGWRYTECPNGCGTTITDGGGVRAGCR